jgi:hypothetical protein
MIKIASNIMHEKTHFFCVKLHYKCGDPPNHLKLSFLRRSLLGCIVIGGLKKAWPHSSQVSNNSGFKVLRGTRILAHAREEAPKNLATGHGATPTVVRSSTNVVPCCMYV